MKKCNLLIIATNKYTQFVLPLIESAEKYFLKDCQVTYNIFTDKVDEVSEILDSQTKEIRYLIFPVEHHPWPHATLKRCHFFKLHEQHLIADHHFYIDADTLITAPITSEDILGERVATQHCGFTDQRGSYERNPESTSYVSPEEGVGYYGGGFYGFSNNEFWKFVNTMIKMIDTDASRGIIPEHHDESAANRYWIDNPPTRILTPSYHWPEGCQGLIDRWSQFYECKILLLSKNHSEIRS